MIKLFEQFNNEQEIREICEKYNIKNYTINPDGSIDVNGDVYISGYRLSKLPLMFDNVSGDFSCGNNILTTLEGSPKWVGGDFDCHRNNFTSLNGCPIIIDGNLYIEYNQISLIDISIKVKGNIVFTGCNFDYRIESLSQDKLRILFEHGVDYNIFDKDGSINNSRLKRMFSDFNI